MAKTSIHIQPVKKGSEPHNKRKKKLSYVREDLSHLNQYWECDTQANRLESIKALYKAKTGQKMQAKATPIREGVVVIKNNTTMKDLQRLADAYRTRFGVEVFQIAIHKDEGHKDSKDWKPNLHAHMVFDWTDKSTGKSIKLNRQKMIEMQTVTAEVLGMDRGKSSDVKHLSAIQYKVEAESQRIKQLSTQRAAKESAIESIKAAGEWVTDALQGTKKALQQRIKELEGQLPVEWEKGRKAGIKEAIKAILKAARLQDQNVTPKQIGETLGCKIDEVDQLKKEVEDAKHASSFEIYKSYTNGWQDAGDRVKGLETDVKELISKFAGNDPKVLREYSIPREERKFDLDMLDKSRLGTSLQFDKPAEQAEVQEQEQQYKRGRGR